MIAELGHLALIAALALSIAMVALSFWGAWRGHYAAMNAAPPLTLAMAACVFLAFAILINRFLADDFSLAVVAANSNSLLPSAYKFSATWGNHEGSLLLWVTILSAWMVAVALLSRGLPLVVLARVLAVLGIIAIGFLLFSLLTSNPFERLLPGTPGEGRDLNPLLQDPGLVIHPPLLYMGYVGLAVPFAFSLAALMGGRLDAAWARWSRPWTNVAWAFLTLGIMLGSWWAYYELGWGGWWFWDPVENASFMPWLVGTALVHSLAVTEKRGVFRAWTVLLAITAFSLSLLGTFLVRSGVLTSVHAFAADPERGVFILIFLGLVVGGSLILYALRAPTVASAVRYHWVSRETLLMVNNLVLSVSAFTVLTGTLYPLLMDALGQGKYSVGPPYFNAVFVPLMALLLPFMGLGPVSRWKTDALSRWRESLMLPGLAVLLLAVVTPFWGAQFNVWIALSVLLAAWVVAGLVVDLRVRWRGATNAAQRRARWTASVLGLQLAHLGFAMSVVGAVVVTQLSEERDLRMAVGDQLEVSGYTVVFESLAPIEGPNYAASRGEFALLQNNILVSRLHAEKRRYFASGQMMTEAGIDAGFTRDVYVALGEPLDDGAWSVRVQYKPFVRWIWLGAILMGLGGLVTAFDRRYRAGRYRPARISGAVDVAP